jgi:hypothetical protein
MINAQDTLSPPQFWFNSTLFALPKLGGGYFADGTKMFSGGIDYQNIISRKKISTDKLE